MARTPSKSKNGAFCSFCGRAAEEAPQMIASPAGVHICADCVKVCDRMLGGDTAEPGEDGEPAAGKTLPIPKLKVPKPADLKTHYFQVLGEDLLPGW